MSDLSVAIAAIVGIVALTAALIAVSSLLNGFVLSILWGWFIVPLFGLPQLSLPYAIGIGMVVSFLTYQHVDSGKSENALATLVGLIIARPALTLLLGWIVQSFI